VDDYGVPEPSPLVTTVVLEELELIVLPPLEPDT
jgi:hypothetical protein